MTLADNQHLEFLISQYVDDTLDAADRKLVEQQIATDPVARQLYKDHHDTQELLEEFGGRIPLINWNEFDNKLAARLADEARTMSTQPQISAWRRWGKPAAIAAGLMIAAGIGYGWHAFTQPISPVQPMANVSVEARPVRMVQVSDQPSTGPSRQSVSVLEVPGETTMTAAVKVQDDSAQLAEAPKDSSNSGRKPANPVPGSVTAAGAPEISGDAPVENLR